MGADVLRADGRDDGRDIHHIAAGAGDLFDLRPRSEPDQVGSHGDGEAGQGGSDTAARVAGYRRLKLAALTEEVVSDAWKDDDRMTDGRE